MALHLRLRSVRTSSQLRAAANPNELASEGYRVEDGYVIVESQAEADELLSTYSNLELDLSAGSDDSDAQPTCAGTKANGEPCTRTVDAAGEYCYQHG